MKYTVHAINMNYAIYPDNRPGGYAAIHRNTGRHAINGDEVTFCKFYRIDEGSKAHQKRRRKRIFAAMNALLKRR